MIQEKIRVLYNHNLGNAYYRIGLTCNRIYENAIPGQFIMLRLSGSDVPLLRRPFSIHRLIFQDDNLEGIELLFKVVGKGTERLAMYVKDDRLDLLGPLGNGFPVQEHFNRIFIAAGGIGVAPMLFLANSLSKMGEQHVKCTVFLGAKSKQDLLCSDEFRDHGMEVVVCTDDGSAGTFGLVTQPLEIAINNEKPDIMYACGPLAMLRRVIDLANVHTVPCQVSIETLMACGVGACLGCAVGIRDNSETYLHACKDGPVFDAKKIVITPP